MTDTLPISRVHEFKAELFAPWVQDLDFTVESVDAEGAVLRMPFSDRLTRVGGTICGQALMALADTSVVFALSGAFGEFRPMTTVTQSTSFMRAISGTAVLAKARLLRIGKTMAFAEITLYAEGDDRPAVHVTSTYAILPVKG
ncbi:MAG: thioesterase [Rhodospirillaceae bacterium BRH_c57]|nr:MAG: thioesterase [Rhodospirillaceae bacterium BRH_c57]